MKSLFQIHGPLKFEFCPESNPSNIKHITDLIPFLSRSPPPTLPPVQEVHFICLFIYLLLAVGHTASLKEGRVALEPHRD